MTLTSRKSQSLQDDRFPAAQLFVLAIVRLAEPVALTSVFPYAWTFIKSFNVVNEKDASFYAGLFISAFSLSEALTSMFWGSLSDRIGRRPVLLIGCVGTFISLLIVGFAPSIWIALIGRSLGGLLNGNIAVIQTMVGELVTRPEHEPRAYSIMPFVWSIGTIVGPVIGGITAEPATNFPGTFSPDGLFGKYPYLLPNLICAGLLLVSIVLGVYVLEETHPDKIPSKTMSPLDSPNQKGSPETSPLIGGVKDTRDAQTAYDDSETYGTFDGDEDSSGPKRAITKQVIALIMAMGLFSYHSMTYDAMFPIWLQDDSGDYSTSAITGSRMTSLGYQRSSDSLPLQVSSSADGLGLSLPTVGLIMSIDGLIAVVVQVALFPLMARWLGIYNLFILVTVLGPLVYIVIPFISHLPENLVFPGIYLSLAFRNFVHIQQYPVLLIMIKEATPSHSVLGKINGLAASAGAGCRTISPPIAGFLYSVGTRLQLPGLAWYGSASVACVGIFQGLFVQRMKDPLSNVGIQDLDDRESGVLQSHESVAAFSRDE